MPAAHAVFYITYEFLLAPAQRERQIPNDIYCGSVLEVDGLFKASPQNGCARQAPSVGGIHSPN